MKTNLNIALELIDKGLSTKTLSKLTEGQIITLHKKLVGEQVTKKPPKESYNVGKAGGELPPNPKGYEMNTNPDGTMTATAKESEVKEDETDDVTDKNSLGADALQSLTGQEAPHDANDMAPDGMDDDSDTNRKMMGMSESDKNPEKNPWSICHAQLGPKKNAKFERCVRQVKKSLSEGKNPISLFLENEIMKIVEKNLPPRITKGDLIKYLAEAGPAVAPTKPKPTTKPGKPATKPPQKPKHPGKNPLPGVKPAPKAISPERAKDEVINVIMNLLEK